MNKLIDKMMELLPQTQCQQCGHPGCQPYATALAAHQDEPNKCIPGGLDVWQQLCAVLDLEPHNPGTLKPQESSTTITINSNECIGCTKCIAACPVDAIIGSNGYMHAVIPEVCTGCNLCIPKCPVDCIDILSSSETERVTEPNNQQSLTRYQRKTARLEHNRRLEIQKHKKAKLVGNNRAQTEESRLDYIAAARKRRQQRGQKPPQPE